jgi:hypothetical protein
MAKVRRNPLNKELAKPGDPMVTASGVVIAPDRDGVDLTVHDGPINAKAFRPRKQRAAKDLPAPPQMMKAVACVFLLTTLGLTERETADTLGITLGDLKAVKNGQTYAECFNEVVSELINANSEMLAARVASYAGKAVDNIAHLAEFAKKDETKLTANRDLADRAGIGVQKGMSIGIAGNELRIQIIDGGSKTADISIQQ